MEPAEVTFDESSFEGFPVLSHFPSNMSALVFMFHGSGGSERFIQRLENREIMARLIPLGYGFVSTASTLRAAPRRWQADSVNPKENADLARIQRLYDELVENKVIGKTNPVFAMGMSNGAAFTGVFAMAAAGMGMPVAAVALYEGPFTRAVVEAMREGRPMPPAFQVLAVNDPLVGFTPQMKNAKAIAEAGYSLDLQIAEERAVTPADFQGIPEIGTRAQEVFDRLVAARVIDEAGKRLIELRPGREGLSASLQSFAETLNALPAADSIRDQLLIAWASHKMRSDFASEQVAFFERHRNRLN
ncbi:MAG: hypothetical protein ACFHX7_04820 [Pseudomonadota bacterium]